jgi:hypothetical protein
MVVAGDTLGLDWNPLARPKAGEEAEFERLFNDLKSEQTSRGAGLLSRLLGPRRLTKVEREAKLERFQAISEAPFVTLGAPRVGIDPAANAWLHGKLQANGKLADLDQARQEMHGYYVLDLLPPCDGFPLYSNHGAYEGVDRYSFRGQFLNDTKHIIGPELHEQAWSRMLARELEAYAAALEEATRPWAERAGVAQVERAIEAPPFGEDDPASQAHILFGAVRWCRFWASRGHGLEPWF